MNDNIMSPKQYQISNKYIDSEGKEQIRASSEDFHTLSHRHIEVIKNIPELKDNEEILMWLIQANINYDIGDYVKALQHLTWALNKLPVLEKYIFYYIRICNSVLSTPLTKEEIEYDIKLARYRALPKNLKWLMFRFKMKVQCKWCGRYTEFVHPDVPSFGFASQDNSCLFCKRMYPMPSWMWDSPDGRAYSYYRMSFSDDEFYEEFEQDFNPIPLCKHRQKKSSLDDSDKELSAENYFCLGEAFRSQYEFKHAEEMFKKAIIIKESFGLKEDLVKNYIVLGELYWDKHKFIVHELEDYEEEVYFNLALKFYNKAVAINKSLGRSEELADNYMTIGDKYHFNIDYLENAEKEYKKAISIYESIGCMEKLANAYDILGELYFNMEEFCDDDGYTDLGIESLTNAILVYEMLGRKEEMAKNYGKVGFYYSRNDLNLSKKAYENAIKINELLGPNENLANNYKELGSLYNDMIISEEMYKKAISINEVIGHKTELSECYHNLGLLYADNGKYEDAEKMYLEALAHLDSKDDASTGFLNIGVFLESNLYINLATLYENLNDFNSAKEYYIKAIDIDRKLGREHCLRVNFRNLGKLYESLNKKDLAEEMYNMAEKYGCNKK